MQADQDVPEAPTSSEMSGEPPAATIEIELGPEDLSPRPATGVETSSLDAARPSNVQRQVTRITGALTVMFAFVMLRSFAQYAGLVAVEPQPVGKALASLPSPAPAPAPQLVPEEPPQQVSLPLRMANPFDSAEVFEFPAGTSKAEAREWVANLLMQRARDRRPQLGAARRRARQPIPSDTSAS